MRRTTFILTAIALTARPCTAPAATIAVRQEIVALLSVFRSIRTVWRPPSLFRPDSPIVAYVRPGGDAHYPTESLLWLNPDHPELISPRRSHPDDEEPLYTALVLAALDRPERVAFSFGGRDDAGRRLGAMALAHEIATNAKLAVDLYPSVDDAEFTRRKFAFAVLRQLTPGIGGVQVISVNPHVLPKEEPFFVYHGNGIIYINETGEGSQSLAHDAFVRAWICATADRQPIGSEVKQAWDAAESIDLKIGGETHVSRDAFARRYVDQVNALFAPPDLRG